MLALAYPRPFNFKHTDTVGHKNGETIFMAKLANVQHL